MQLSAAVPFLEKLVPELSSTGIDLTSFVCDHICYRVSNLVEYETEKIFLATQGTLLAESDVNGRPIATYRLNQPIQGAGLEIWIIELPAPKTGRPVESGFEHIEFATGFHPKKLTALYPNLQFKTSGMTKSFNAELELKLTSGSVKFHELSLERVIEIEIELADRE